MTSQTINTSALDIATEINKILDAAQQKDYPMFEGLKSDFACFFFDGELLKIVSDKTVTSAVGRAQREDLISELIRGISHFDDPKVVRRMEKLLNTIKLYEKSIEVHQLGKSAFEGYASDVLRKSMAVNTHLLYPDFFLIWRPYMTEFGRQSRDFLKVIRKISNRN